MIDFNFDTIIFKYMRVNINLVLIFLKLSMLVQFSSQFLNDWVDLLQFLIRFQVCSYIFFISN